MKNLHANASPQARDFLRIWVFGIWLLIIVFEPLQLIGQLPESIYHPIGFFLKILPSSLNALLITGPFLLGLKIILIIGLLCVLTKTFLKTSAILSCLFLTIEQGIIRGFSNPHHGEILLLYAAYIITLCYLADHVFKKNPKGDSSASINLNSIPFILILTALCMTYSFIGTSRLLRGGFAIFQSDSLMYWIVQNSQTPGFCSWHVDYLIFQHPWIRGILNMGFLAGTVMEIAAPLCLVSRKFRHCFLLFMIPFHLTIWIFMGILFWHQLALYILFFNISDWSILQKLYNKKQL